MTISGPGGITSGTARAEAEGEMSDIAEDRMTPRVQQPINKIVELVNEAVTVSGMTKDETEDLRQALEDFAAGILSVRR
mgnify:CR=1 FL=1